MNGARGVRISAARQKNDPGRYSCGIYEALTDEKCKNKEGNGYREVFQDGTTAFKSCSGNESPVLRKSMGLGLKIELSYIDITISPPADSLSCPPH